MNQSFIAYQTCRQVIPYFKKLQEFKQDIRWISHSLDEDAWIGLIREFRAFWYLKGNRKFGLVFKMSETSLDKQGIDIISYDEKHNVKYTFSVSGFSKDTRADYSIIVKKDIWIYKNKEKDVAIAKM